MIQLQGTAPQENPPRARSAKEERTMRIWAAARHFFSFFLLMSFVTTCCMVLFLNTMMYATGLSLGEAEIKQAAVVTFLNVIFLSLLCALIDAVRRRIMVDRPVRKIIRAAQRVMQGDLSVRIERGKSIDPNDGFNTITEYFNRMIEELGGMETLRADFIANVSHELKTPLAVMENYGTLLQQPELSDDKRLEYAKNIIDASRNLAGMVTNILKLNKLENQTIYPDAHVYDLSEQICECLLIFEDVWETGGIKIETQIEENVRISADPELLSLVWNNLFSNAFKFTPHGGRVSVLLKTQGNTAVVEVSDTGCGFGKEVGVRIFEKFYQGDTSRATKGNGLGLALVKRVMDITGGNISVASEVGKGSVFTVTLGREGDGTD